MKRRMLYNRPRGYRKSKLEKKLYPHNTLLLMKMKNKGIDIYRKLFKKNNKFKGMRKENCKDEKD